MSSRLIGHRSEAAMRWSRKLTLGVRAASGPARRRASLIPIGPGETVTLDASLLRGNGAAFGHRLTLAVGPIARLDVPGLLLSA